MEKHGKTQFLDGTSMENLLEHRGKPMEDHHFYEVNVAYFQRFLWARASIVMQEMTTGYPIHMTITIKSVKVPLLIQTSLNHC